MRIVFVRHGEPDYVRDCLTEEGRRQAAACAERLAGEDIRVVYASPCGRAEETAAFTARRLNLPIVTLDYMHEISWGGPEVPHDGHPWTLGDMMLEENFDFHAGDWREHPYFKRNIATEYCDRIAERIDGLLADYGYRHEGRRFLCRGGSDATIALFSHGGSGACALAHLLSLPFPYVACVLPYDFTSIIILELPVREGEYVHARLELFNDCAHIRREAGGPKLQQRTDEAFRRESGDDRVQPGF